MITQLTSNPIATLAALCLLAMFVLSLIKDVRLAIPRWFLSTVFLAAACYAAASALGHPSIETLQGWMQR